MYAGLNDEIDANINATATDTLHNWAIDNEGLNLEIVNALLEMSIGNWIINRIQETQESVI